MLNFLIRIKGEAGQIVSLYPLFYTILNQDIQNRINLIVDEEFDYNQLWLPRGVRTYPIPKSKVDGVFGVHHFAANLHEVFNVDYYIDYICDFHSAFIGLAFKAKRRIGLAGGPKSYFYTHTLESFKGLFDDEKCLAVKPLIPELDNFEVFEYRPEIKKDYKTCLIDLSNFEDSIYLLQILKIVEIMELSFFYFIPKEKEQDFQKSEDPSIALLKDKGQFFTEAIDEMVNKLSGFDIVVSANYLFAIFSHLQGKRVAYITDENFIEPVCRFIDICTLILEFHQGDLVKYGIGELKEVRVVPSEMYDYLLSYHTLRLEPSV